MLQDGQIIDEIIHDQEEMEGERSAWEPIWKEVDQRVNPLSEGGFDQQSKGNARGLQIFDHTASLGLDRFTAAYTGMIIPRGERYHTLSTTDSALNDLPAMRAWLEYASDKLFAARYAPSAGFDPEANMNIRSLGSYGSAPFWIDVDADKGIYYKTHHLSECYVKEDYRGRIDTNHRKFKMTVRQAKQQFGEQNLTPKMAKDLAARKLNVEHDVLHVVRPRQNRDPERLDFRRFAFESRYIALGEKLQIRESGYSTMPMAFSRYATAPRERYGRSPAIQVLGSIRTVNEMAKTILRAGHKAVDPPLLVPEDGVLSQIKTMPGGINPGGLGFDGQPTVVPMVTGGNLPIGMELLNNEREPIRDAFLERVWSLVLERKDRMTATEVLEITRMQGMLLAPMASRQETEWLGVQIERELDIHLRTGYILPPPPEFREAGAAVKVIYDNPLSRAALAEEAIGFSRFVEMLGPLAAVVGPEVYDAIDTIRAPRELGKSLAVRSKYMSSDDDIAAKRDARAEQEQTQNILAQMKTASEATANLAQARSEETALAA